MQQFKFTVDTHLFRELGELLVGRDSTALIELIKNSYDADATAVYIRGENLRNSGFIEISDNGVGMTDEVFRTAFLRIAGRYKEGGNRLSPLYGRRYTGAKGVGRLSAHKLARELTIRSIPRSDTSSDQENRPAGIDASINWERLESENETIDAVVNGLTANVIAQTGEEPPGTTLTLRGLKAAWKPAQLTRFLDEFHSARPANELMNAPRSGTIGGPSLLGDVRPWTTGANDPGFHIVTEGDFSTGEPLWSELISRSHWLLEVDASGPRVEFSIQPTLMYIEREGPCRSYSFTTEHPSPIEGPFFTARIYAREGRLGENRASELARFNQRRGGVRLYLEGFRVLPYGGRRDDWLGLDRDYARKPRSFEISLDKSSLAELPVQDTEGYLSQGNDQYFGAVFLTADGAERLRPVVNREGFVEDEYFESLRDLVRNGIDLVTRARAARRREQQAEAESADEAILQADLQRRLSNPQRDSGMVVPEPSTAEPKQQSETQIRNPLITAKQELTLLGASPSISRDDRSQVERAQIAVEMAENRARAWDEERTMFRVLAGVGLQFAAFVHEINGILGQANSVRELAEFLVSATDLNEKRRILRALSEAVDRLVQSLTRQSSYLTDVVGPDARRRRRRLRLPETIKASAQLLTSTLSQRSIQLEISMDPSVKTPPIFPAEMTVIMTNLLTNAIKAAGNGGVIAVHGSEIEGEGVRIFVENTGTAVDLIDAERWFQPFESTTTEMDVVLGQGLGLGLPITRRIVEEYGGSVKFVAPSERFATAVEISLPGRGVRS